MSKKRYRFFGGLLAAQEKWLNKMSEKGYRLIRTGKLLYEFEECGPNQVNYRVEFIGEKSKGSAQEYKRFLEDMGYQVFYKNINLNWSLGKMRWRPWAEKGGRLATNATTFNRELLIVGKENDGRPFELHTTHEDKASYYRTLRAPWLLLVLLSGVLGVIGRSLIAAAIASVSLIPVVTYQVQIWNIRREVKTREW